MTWSSIGRQKKEAEEGVEFEASGSGELGLGGLGFSRSGVGNRGLEG